MRILALGAGGEMGATAAGVLAADAAVSEIVVADRDLERATATAQTLGPKASARRVDASDAGALFAAMRGMDLVVNSTGPYFRFGVTILKSAIDAGCDYVDICDDPYPTLQMLDLDAQARAAGVTALIGAGASPGIANMLAVVAGWELTRVDTMVTGWNIAAAHPERIDGASASAASVHIMEQLGDAIPVTRDGDLATCQALKKVPLCFPGLGRMRAHTVGHPEAVTLHRAFPELRESTNVCVGDRLTMSVLRSLRRLVATRILSRERAARWVERASALLGANVADMFRPGSLPPIFAIATGLHAGKPATVGAALANYPGYSMAAVTGVPLAVAALLMPSARQPGVHTMETLFDPPSFFRAFAPYCIGRPAPEAMTVITRSWASPETNRQALRASALTELLAHGIH